MYRADAMMTAAASVRAKQLSLLLAGTRQSSFQFFGRVLVHLEG
jgi:hypothetical protein